MASIETGGMKCIKYLLFAFNLIFAVSTNNFTLKNDAGGFPKSLKKISDSILASEISIKALILVVRDHESMRSDQMFLYI